MKPIDILDALSDLPEEYTAFALRNRAAQSAAGETTKESEALGGITMKKQSVEKSPSFHISRAGIAAVVAVCIGLNAALVYGIMSMRNDPGAYTTPAAAPEVQDLDRPYMETVDAMPTCITVRIVNSTNAYESYNPYYIITQNGEKVADAEILPESLLDFSKGVNAQQLIYEQLPSGSYTLVNLAKDGKTEGILGHLDFEISAEYDDMVYIAEHKGEDYESVEAELISQGFQISKRSAYFQGSEEGAVEAGKVISIAPEPYMTEQSGDNGTTAHYHCDGRGYWTEKGCTVEVLVSLGAVNSEPVTVPYVVGQDFETAKNELLFLGLYIDKRSAYDDDFPAGTVIKETVDDKDVPEEGMEAAAGSYVIVTVSLGKNSENAPAE